MNMIEKVAIAIQNALNINDVELASIAAKAAIDAMRDYYDNEFSAFEACDVPLNSIPSLNQMIDAALKEE